MPHRKRAVGGNETQHQHSNGAVSQPHRPYLGQALKLVTGQPANGQRRSQQEAAKHGLGQPMHATFEQRAVVPLLLIEVAAFRVDAR